MFGVSSDEIPSEQQGTESPALSPQAETQSGQTKSSEASTTASSGTQNDHDNVQGDRTKPAATTGSADFETRPSDVGDPAPTPISSQAPSISESPQNYFPEKSQHVSTPPTLPPIPAAYQPTSWASDHDTLPIVISSSTIDPGSQANILSSHSFSSELYKGNLDGSAYTLFTISPEATTRGAGFGDVHVSGSGLKPTKKNSLNGSVPLMFTGGSPSRLKNHAWMVALAVVALWIEVSSS